MKKIPTIVFKAKNKEGRYLCDGPDCGDWDDEYLDTKNITDALHVVKQDHTKPGDESLQEFYELIKSLPVSNDVDFIKANYEPVDYEITEEQFKEIRDRNGW